MNISKAHRPSLLQRINRFLFRVIFLSGVMASLVFVGAVLFLLYHTGAFDEHDRALHLIAEMKAPDNSAVFDRQGKKIGEFFNNYHVFTPIAQVPDCLKNAIVAIEDRNFWIHPGYDIRAIARAAWVYVKRRHLEQGGSTITQQIVRNFLLTTEKSMDRKIMEIVLASQLEKRMTKEKILEIYVNELFLGNGSYGVGAAAYRYFGKPVQQLELHEAALIAGLFQSPTSYNPERYLDRAKARQRHVLEAMVDSEMITLPEAERAYAQPLKIQKYLPLRMETAPYFVDYIESEATRLLKGTGRLGDGGLRIHTTLDSTLQKLADQSVREVAPELDKQVVSASREHGNIVPAPKLEVALMALNPKTGEVLAMVGGRDYRQNQFNRVTSSLRSPGSAFKPVVYSLALSRGYKWNDVIYVEPITVKDFRPRNTENDFGTETTLLRAFYRSMNTPTVDLARHLGLGAILAHAARLGVRSPLKNEIGTTLGGSEVSLWDLARLYSVFANHGKRIEPIGIQKIQDRNNGLTYAAPSIVARSTDTGITPTVAYLMIEGMRTVLERGTAVDGRELASVAVGKTGTSNDSTDNWFCGVTPNLVTIVWVGTDDHTPLPSDARGSTLALPIWKSFMHKVQAIRRFASFERPSDVETALVHPLYGNRMERGGVKMFFKKGQAPERGPSALESVTKKNSSYRNLFQE
jgi:1A family penicillin-binding protein